MQAGPYSHIPPRGPGKIPARQRVLAQWRNVDLAPAEKARTATAKSADRAMTGVLSELGLDRRRIEVEIVKVWNNMLQPDVIAHAQPVRLRKGTLFISVDNSTWLSELVRFRYEKILELMQHTFGKEFIKKLSFRIGH